LRVQEQGPERVLLRGLVLTPQQALLRMQEREAQREQERGPVWAEDLTLLRVLLRLEELRPEQGLLMGQERALHLGQEQHLLRAEERGMEQGQELPLRPPPLNYPSGARSQPGDNRRVMTRARDLFICRLLNRLRMAKFA
jgi:hypothetical protein